MAITQRTEAVEPVWTLGNRIWRARLHAGLEQSEVAKALGVSRALVSRWEKDLSDPRVGQLQGLAELTGVSYVWLSSATGHNPDGAALADASFHPVRPTQLEMAYDADANPRLLALSSGAQSR